MASQILRVSIKGDLPGGEVWSTNPCWEIDGIGGQLVTAGDAQAIASALALVTIPSILTTIMATNTRLTGYRVEARQIGGSLEAQGEATRATPSNGGGSASHGNTAALVLSLRTPGVGGSSRGRMYWPATGLPLDIATYRVDAVTLAAILAGFKTYLSGMTTAIRATLPNADLTVWSRKTSNFHNVNAIQLGNILDTQRRRRDTLVEGYTALAFP